MNSAGRNQWIKIDYRKSNRSIDANRCMLVNCHRLVSANQWPIDNHPKVFRNHWLPSIGLQKLFVISLFQALDQWGRSESSAGRGDERGLIEKEGATRNQMTPLVLLPWQQFCRWCCVNKNCDFRFCFKTRTIYPTQSNDGTEDNMGTISVPSRTLCPTVEVANGIFLLFDRKRLGPKELLWKRH